MHGQDEAARPATVLISAFVARDACAELLEYCIREHEVVTSAPVPEEVRLNGVFVADAELALGITRAAAVKGARTWKSGSTAAATTRRLPRAGACIRF